MNDKLIKGTVIDVRTPEEFSGGHYPNAINIPLESVAQRINEFTEMPKPICLLQNWEPQWKCSFYFKAKWN